MNDKLAKMNVKCTRQYYVANYSLSEGDRFLLKLVEVLVVYAQVFELSDLGGLYVLDLLSLVTDFFSDLSSLLKIIESILFFDTFVGRDLGSDFLGMFNEGILLLFFNLSFLLLDLLLLLDLIHVIFPLDSGLFGETGLFLRELLLSGNLKISLDSLSLLVLESFTLSGLSFSFLESSLGPKSIDLSLSISSLFLELSESLDFLFFFILDSSGLKLSFVLLLVLGSLILNDLLFMVLFLTGSFLLLDQGLSICLGSLFHQVVDSHSFGLRCFSILSLHLFNIGQKVHLFLISDFLFSHSFDGSLLDLINDDLSTLLSGSMLSNFSFFLLLENLESFDFHHQIKLFLLFNPFLLKSLIFLELFVTDGDDLGVQNHLVHVLDIVHIIIECLLSFGKECISLVLLADGKFVWL